jgi:VanZ family protein
LQWATVAFLCTSLVATLDEWHQSFLPSRTGTFQDVILDSSAGLIAQIALFVMRHMRSLKTKRGVLPEIDVS